MFQVPEYGEGADHRERVKHFVYDYAYTTKSGPIPKLQENSLSPRYPSLTSNNLSLKSTQPSVWNGAGTDESGFTPGNPTADASTPLYFTSSSPFVLPPSLATFNSGNSSRNFYSLPCFASSLYSQNRQYSSLENDRLSSSKDNSDQLSDNIDKNGSEQQLREKENQNNLQLSNSTTRFSERWHHWNQQFPKTSSQDRIRSLQHQRTRRCSSTNLPPPPIVPFHPGRPPSQRTETTLGPVTIPLTPSLAPHVPPNTPIGGSIKSRSHRSVSCSQPYPVRDPTRIRSRSNVEHGSGLRGLQCGKPCNEWALPPSPEEAYWQAASQDEVRLYYYYS